MHASPSTPTQDNVRWMCGLHELARGWVNAMRSPIATSQTDAYVDLTFAFALARIGASDESERCSRRAIGQLAGLDEAHLILQQMYGYRIAQARLGKDHKGTFPPEIVEYIEQMGRLLRYNVDRLRKHSRILEPDQRINPFRHWGARISDFEKALAELAGMTDADKLVARVEELLDEAPKATSGNERRARVLRAGLEAAPRVGDEFARKMLGGAVPAYDALPKAEKVFDVMDQALFLERMLVVAGYFQIRDVVQPLLDRVRTLLGPLSAGGLIAVTSLIRQCVHLLTELRMGDELDSFLGEVAGLVLGGTPIEQLSIKADESLAPLFVMLCLAEGWYGFGWDRLAEPVTQKAWTLLLSGSLTPRSTTQLACAYAECLGKAPSVARDRLENIFRELTGITDTYTASTHFSISQFEVVESVALAALEVCRPR